MYGGGQLLLSLPLSAVFSLALLEFLRSEGREKGSLPLFLLGCSRVVEPYQRAWKNSLPVRASRGQLANETAESKFRNETQLSFQSLNPESVTEKLRVTSECTWNDRETRSAKELNNLTVEVWLRAKWKIEYDARGFDVFGNGVVREETLRLFLLRFWNPFWDDLENIELSFWR